MRRWLSKVLTLGGTPHGIAGGFALGLGLSLVPIPVLGMVVALALAPILRLNPPATYLGTAVVNPVTAAFLYFAELWLGMTLLGRDAPPFAELRTLGAGGWWALVLDMVGPFALGASLLVATGTALGYVVVLVGARRYQAHKKKALPHPPGGGLGGGTKKADATEAPASSSNES